MSLSNLNPEMQKKLIERIKALFRLGDKERNNSEAEAEVATAKAQELLQKYNLSLSEVLNTDEDLKKSAGDIVDEVAKEMNKSSLSSWENNLTITVGECCECKTYRQVWKRGKSSTFSLRFVGTKWDVAIAVELFNYLHKTLLRKSRVNYRDNLPLQRSYLEGACYRLEQRVREQTEQFKREQVKNQKFALMVINKKDAIDNYMQNELDLRQTKARDRKPVDSRAFHRGVADANAIDLGNSNKIASTAQANEEEIERQDKNRKAVQDIADAFAVEDYDELLKNNKDMSD